MTPQDPDHKAMWDAINALKDEISVNGYGVILREIARRYKARQEVWQFFKRPRQLLGKAFWILLGGVAVAVGTHFIK